MFLTEGLLASIVGVWAFFYLDDRPNDAGWLPAVEKQALSAVIAHENLGKISLGLICETVYPQYNHSHAKGNGPCANSPWQKTEISRAVTRHAATER
jgi:hypothetical protein